MTFVKSFLMHSIVTVFMALCSNSYAQENINQVFLYGEAGASTGIQNCSGTCSADTSGTVGAGYLFEFMPVFGSEPHVGSISLEYWRSQYAINGNVLEATRKEIDFNWEQAFDEQRRYVLSLGAGIGWMTVNGPGSLSRTAFNPVAVPKFIYQATPSLALTLGYSHNFILSANQPDFIANNVMLGLRWYP